MCKIVNVIDDIMGKGKTSWAMQYMVNNNDNSFIYVTPFLEEVERCVKKCGFKEPNKISSENKLQSFKNLISRNKSIATTHELFRLIDEETLDLLRNSNYILILDEVLDVVEETTMNKCDIENLIELGILKYNENGNISEGDLEIIKRKSKELNEYQHIAINLLRHNLEILDGKKKVALLWLFPIDILDSFKNIYIMTFMFDGYPMSGYLKYNNYKIKKYSINIINQYDEYKNRIFKLVDYKFPDVALLKKLITIIDVGKINNIGESQNSLSYSWWKARITNKYHKDWIQIKNNINNYINNYSNTRAKNKILWTSFKETRSSLYTRSLSDDNFVSYNVRATNKYKDKTSVIYLINKNYNPIILNWFYKKGIKIDKEAYALGECMQLIWRTAIRENKEISIYIPSKKMRELLIEFLNK
jgi:hypothetical protein